MVDWVQYIPVWRRIVNSLTEGKSVIITIPRFSGSKDLMLAARRRFEQSVICVEIEISRAVQLGLLSYATLWQGIAEELQYRGNWKVDDRSELEAGLLKVLGTRRRPTILLLDGGGRIEEEEFYNLLMSLDYVASQLQGGEVNFRFLVTNEFVLERYERAKGDELRSRFRITYRLRWAPLSLNELYEMLCRVLKGQDSGTEDVKQIAAKLSELTGGHSGLVKEILEDLEAREWRYDQGYWLDEAKKVLGDGHVLNGLRRCIEEDAMGIAQTALEYTTPDYPREPGSPRIQIMQELGVVYRASGSTIALFPGMIGEFMQGVSRAKREKRLGTVASWSGMRRFEGEALKPEDNDFVVLHLSDLHIGKEHAFRLPYRKGVLNEGKSSLVGVVTQDILSLDLDRRVDALVVSGDVTCNGNHEEFLRASEVIKELLLKLALGEDRLVVVAGNHDIDWSPGDFAVGVENRDDVSREPFDKFVEQFGKPGKGRPYLVEVVARSGRRRLQLLAMDSNYVEGPESAGIGYVSRESLEKAEELLRQSGGGDEEEVLIWLILHHHVLPIISAELGEARGRRVSVMGNAAEVFAKARRWRVEMILHGHQHQPALTLAQRGQGMVEDLDLRGVAVLGAGSCGAYREALGPIARNQYYVIARRVADFVIRSRIMGEQELRFVAHNDFVLGW
jgi:hypothetical protein